MNTPVKKTKILYMDDDPDDVEMLQEALFSLDPAYVLVKAGDGREGLRLLERLKAASDLPCLIVLDLNMPGMDGRETFVNIRRDASLNEIPVVIFSTSNSLLDKLFFKDKHAEYITKPIQYNLLVEVAKRLLSYCD